MTPTRGANTTGRGGSVCWGRAGRALAWLQPRSRLAEGAGGRPAPRCCPCSAVAVGDTPRDGPARLSHTVNTPRLQSLRMDLCHVPGTREKGWYLALMAPNVKGPNYAWLDPSRLYCHPQGLQDCVAELLQPFQGDAIDMVAGIDAMGFILGAAAAATLRKGFLAIRKVGHLCVQTVTQPYTDYSGREKVMEVRTDAISPGVAAICIEDSEGARWIRERYKCAHCVPPQLQPRFDQHQLGWD
ncbi:adenine phosphoribosyltransferase-like isoform X2 [Cuculus canorus]|uniref:adenine phosphoribosyltransferase-like isoform X2 n=1 Tax=Cuculus canorus TaxID=55661 RepID=UPI0023AA52B6|nr:adenine phosphoribosyltransferase-like isoform X2 [Cuculus canorus]